MKQNLTFIPLRMTAVSDRRSILSAYSRQLGPVAFIISTGSSKEAVRQRALLQPLGIVEGVASKKAGSELMSLSQLRPVTTLAGLYGANPVKNAIVQFLTEVLSMLLRESQPDEAVFDFIVLALRRLSDSNTREAANFHICFLLHLSRLLGIEPDWSSYRQGYIFNLDEGRFCRAGTIASRLLTPDESYAAHRLSRMTFANLGFFRFTREQRNAAIDAILGYYSVHYVGLGTLHSLDILRALF